MANRNSKSSDINNMTASTLRDVEAQKPPPSGSETRSTSSPITAGRTSSPDINRMSTASQSTATNLPLPYLGPSSSKLTEPPPTPDPKSRNHEAIASQAPARHAWWHPITKPAVQMIIAAVLAVVIGVAVAAVGTQVPDAARVLLGIPGDLWLRALKCVVVPLIITSLILAVQRLKQMSGHGARIAKWTLGYYLGFMLIAIGQSTVAAALGWARLFEAVQPSLAADSGLASLNNGTTTTTTTPTSTNGTSPAVAGGGNATTTTAAAPPHQVIVQVFESLIPQNIVEALAADQRLLSVMVIALAVGYLLRPTSLFVKLIKEVEELVAAAVTFLLRIAPVGVFFLILPNLFILPLRAIGRNLGVLIGASLAGMAVHLFLVISLFYLVVVRENPYAFWLRIAPAWMEAWGSGSSAATLPVTMEAVLQQKVPMLVTKFVVPLGVLINMDGTALYFPMAVTFMAATQGLSLNTGEYVIVALLSTLSTIGASPIPGSALVFVVMICGAVHVPVTSMYAVIVAIDWFIDRFRTALNASGDAFAAKVVAKVTGVHDGMDEEAGQYGEKLYERMVEHDLDGDHGRPLRRIGSTLTV